MIVIADTSPLNYLVQIGRQEILPALFGSVFVPREVVDELLRVGAPEIVRSWAAALPAWLVVQSPACVEFTLDLDPGEAAAISLARELRADRVLIDEREGRRIEKELGLHVAGTLAVLRDAASAGLLDLSECFARLKTTTFRASDALYDEILAGFHGRPRAPDSGEPHC